VFRKWSSGLEWEGNKGPPYKFGMGPPMNTPIISRQSEALRTCIFATYTNKPMNMLRTGKCLANAGQQI